MCARASATAAVAVAVAVAALSACGAAGFAPPMRSGAASPGLLRAGGGEEGDADGAAGGGAPAGEDGDGDGDGGVPLELESLGGAGGQRPTFLGLQPLEPGEDGLDNGIPIVTSTIVFLVSTYLTFAPFFMPPEGADPPVPPVF